MPELVDIGVNLAHDSFDADRAEVIARARAAGVAGMIITGTSVADSRKAAELARAHDFYSTAGIHPHHAVDCDAAAIDELRQIAAGPDVVAIGECGLDYFRNFSPPDVQRTAFSSQLELAAELQLPAFLHQRDAHEDFMETLATFRPALPGAVAHCFTGTRAQLEDLLGLDLCIGVTGWVCDERRGADLKAAVPAIPLDRLLLETDSPYLLPRSLRPRPKSRRNEPAHLAHVAAVVAELMDLPAEEVIGASTRNAERLFGIAVG